MNNRVVANGTPLDDRFDNVARMARRAGYAPALFGYTDQGGDPRLASGPDDPRLSTCEGVLPGFDAVLELTEDHRPWVTWLGELGYTIPSAADPDSVALALLASESDAAGRALGVDVPHRRAARRGSTARTSRGSPTPRYLRPHPPYDAAGRFATMYDPADCPAPAPIPARRHPLHDMAARRPRGRRPDRPGGDGPPAGAVLRDDQRGRRSARPGVEHLRGRGMWDDTVVVVTADHGEQLGDQGLMQKLAFFESSYAHRRHRPRSAPARAATARSSSASPRTSTSCRRCARRWASRCRLQCDGFPLTPFLRRRSSPPGGATRPTTSGTGVTCSSDAASTRGRGTAASSASTSPCCASDGRAYVQFGDGSWRCFDLAADPTWQTEVDDPAVVLADAQAMLTWRSQHAERTFTDMLLRDGGIGRVPAGVPRR